MAHRSLRVSCGGDFASQVRGIPTSTAEIISPGLRIRHHKARGEWAEPRFMTRATELGLRVTKPGIVILRSAPSARRRTWARHANILALFARMLNRAFGALPNSLHFLGIH
jgi:hypothetical protein